MANVSKSQIKATKKYDIKTYDRIGFNFRKDAEINKDFIKEYAAARGESINGFLLRAIEETIGRDKNME